jgi:hypothetical protein
MPQHTSSQSHGCSQDLVYDLLKERAAGQLNQADGLDSKANNVIVAASALLAAGLVLQGAILTLQIPTITLTFTYTRPGLTVLFGVYLITMFAAIWGGFWVRSFRQIPEPEPFVEQYLSQPVEKTKSVVIETQIRVYEMNRKIIESKVLSLRVASIGLCLEVISLIVLLLLQIF